MEEVILGMNTFTKACAERAEGPDTARRGGRSVDLYGEHDGEEEEDMKRKKLADHQHIKWTGKAGKLCPRKNKEEMDRE